MNFSIDKSYTTKFHCCPIKLKSIEITFINVTFTKNVTVFLFVHIQDGNFLFTSIEKFPSSSTIDSAPSLSANGSLSSISSQRMSSSVPSSAFVMQHLRNDRLMVSVEMAFQLSRIHWQIWRRSGFRMRPAGVNVWFPASIHSF